MTGGTSEGKGVPFPSSISSRRFQGNAPTGTVGVGVGVGVVSGVGVGSVLGVGVGVGEASGVSS
ncbi:hypothetical protein FD725_25115 [Nostoc sp. TCL26-01]|nr:hypothetical protein FD725_25115 [Nostoc sp. TCL26-01]